MFYDVYGFLPIKFWKKLFFNEFLSSHKKGYFQSLVGRPLSTKTDVLNKKGHSAELVGP